MIRTVHQNRLYADHGESCQNALGEGFLQALFHCREKVPGNCAAEYLFFKDQLVRRIRLELDPDVAVLSVTAGLFLVFALYLDFFPDGLPIGDLRHGKHNLYAEILFQFRNHSSQMLLAQTGQDHLIGCRVLHIGQRLIFFQQFLHRSSHLCLISTGSRTNRHAIAGRRENSSGQAYHTGAVAECVTSAG